MRAAADVFAEPKRFSSDFTSIRLAEKKPGEVEIQNGCRLSLRQRAQAHHQVNVH
jgi:hypothetical protein